ncbi:hypothetical protein AM588_10008472 [Phytophthora nicotianae]|uniref:NECAP PHear domain-containing protein n=1 Tax=Phytophthora nicotianae TaxID=4792 RepID=A0A0W8DSM0_PHYNI|nr:hypothetical protein AM588_10008472 [Phytophthora nicotianae]
MAEVGKSLTAIVTKVLWFLIYAYCLFTFAETEVQRVLATINQVADSWPSTPAWTGRLQVSSVGEDAVIELKDPNTGVLFAACPIKAGGPPAIQKGRHAFIGIAFNNRSDAFDFNVAIDDFNKELKREKTQQETTTAAPPVDYSLKEGQTIRIKLNTKKKDAVKAEEEDDMDPFGSTSSPKKASSSTTGDADLLGFSNSAASSNWETF